MPEADASVSTAPPAPGEPDRRIVVRVLGLTQILAWGSSYYLPAVLGKSIAADTGWPLALVVGGLSLGLLVAALFSPRVARVIQAQGGRPVSGLLAVGLAAAGSRRVNPRIPRRAFWPAR